MNLPPAGPSPFEARKSAHLRVTDYGLKPLAVDAPLLCFDIESGSAQIWPDTRIPGTESNMTIAASHLPVELPPAFLGVSQSATGKLWRDRLDARGAARALAMTAPRGGALRRPVGLQCG